MFSLSENLKSNKHNIIFQEKFNVKTNFDQHYVSIFVIIITW